MDSTGQEAASLWEANPQLIIAVIILILVCIIITIGVSRLAFIRNRNYKEITGLQSDLETALKETREANDAKSKFVANISHEMRTPLNAIVGLSALTLDMEGLDNDTTMNLEKIYDSGMTLLSIVNDILDISKMEAGKFEIIADEYDTPSLINDVISQNLLRLGEKPVDFVLNIDEDLPLCLFGDGLRVKQIINNLLSNACKFTNEGIVKLSIKCLKEKGEFWLIIQVQDTGIGIRKDDLPKLLSDYIQINMESTRTTAGTGLGLSISKMLAEMMGGTITVESEFGKGSTFTVKIKQQLVTDEAVAPEIIANLKNANYSNNKRKQNVKLVRVQIPYARVLIVDDVITNLDVAKGLMRPYKMQIDCALDGQQAIDIIREEKVKYNAIFMDQMMPGLDGIEATRRIREIGTEYAQNIPIIAFTANALVGNEQMFLNKGFQGFISKPIDINRLDRIINRWVRDKLKEESDAPQDDEQPAQASGKPTPNISDWHINGLDMPVSIEKFGGDEDLFLEVLRSFVVNTPAIIEKAKRVSEDTLDRYAIDIHGIKGSCRIIVAHEMAKRAEELEKAAKSENFAFVQKNNEIYLNDVHKFISDIDEMLKTAFQ